MHLDSNKLMSQLIPKRSSYQVSQQLTLPYKLLSKVSTMAKTKGSIEITTLQCLIVDQSKLTIETQLPKEGQVFLCTQ